MKKMLVIQLALVAVGLLVACTPQQARTAENAVLSIADAACLAENAFKFTDSAMVMDFCKIEPNLRDLAKTVVDGAKNGARNVGCAAGQ